MKLIYNALASFLVLAVTTGVVKGQTCNRNGGQTVTFMGECDSRENQTYTEQCDVSYDADQDECRIEAKKDDNKHE